MLVRWLNLTLKGEPSDLRKWGPNGIRISRRTSQPTKKAPFKGICHCGSPIIMNIRIATARL